MRSRVSRNVGFLICALVFGLPGLGFLLFLTWGAISLPFAGMVMLLPFVAINFLLWR
jgi:hypothetical protein